MQGIAQSISSEEVPFRQILDARPEASFLRVGSEFGNATNFNHILGSINVPAHELIEGGRLKQVDQLAKILYSKKVDVIMPTVVIGDDASEDACIVELALRILGCSKTKVYFDTWHSYISNSSQLQSRAGFNNSFHDQFQMILDMQDEETKQRYKAMEQLNREDTKRIARDQEKYQRIMR